MHVGAVGNYTELSKVSRDAGLGPGRLEKAFSEALLADFDADGRILWPSDVKIARAGIDSGPLGSIGVELVKPDEQPGVEIDDVLPGGSALKIDIRVGERLLMVDGKSVNDVEATISALLGPTGSLARLTLEHEGKRRDLSVKRDRSPDEVSARALKTGDGKAVTILPWTRDVAFIRISKLSNGTAAEVERLLAESRDAGANRLVLDLRGNSGGLLSEAARIADIFIEDGLIVETRGADARQTAPPFVAQAQPTDWKGELTILVDHGTAAGAEAIAQSIRIARKEVKLVGESTFGCGSVQLLFPMAQQAAYLTLTASRMRFRDNSTIPAEGLTPDLEVKMEDASRRAILRKWRAVLRTPIAEIDPMAFDPQLKAAVDAMHAARQP